jgi:hypothetical protein
MFGFIELSEAGTNRSPFQPVILIWNGGVPTFHLFGFDRPEPFYAAVKSVDSEKLHKEYGRGPNKTGASRFFGYYDPTQYFLWKKNNVV